MSVQTTLPTGRPADGGRPTGASGEPTWRSRPAQQQPSWPDAAAVAGTTAVLRTMPPLVAAHEVRRLQDRLASVAAGEAFLLQGGDCAETFAGATANAIRDKVRVLLQMAVVLTYGASVPVVKVGRIAGQFAKPRSSDLDASGLPSYRGDMVNALEADPVTRIPDPDRMLRAYHASTSTLNLVRAFAAGGFADLSRVHEWNKSFVLRSSAGTRYEQMAGEIDRTLSFMRACGFDVDGRAAGAARGTELYASHEALVLEYEEALTRREDAEVSDLGERAPRYDLSGHLVWIGERTRQLDGAHVAFAASVANPIGIKIGPTATPDDAVALANAVDPDHVPGRLTFISRCGAGRVGDTLPQVIEKVRAEGWQPVWSCDPMHGNTISTVHGHKTRRFDDVVSEVREFFAVHASLGTHPGGLHVELTGDDVTECTGGGEHLEDGDLGARYETACDPRLNAGQSLELAFLVAEMLQQRTA